MEPELDRLGEKLNQAETSHDAATTLIDWAVNEYSNQPPTWFWERLRSEAANWTAGTIMRIELGFPVGAAIGCLERVKAARTPFDTVSDATFENDFLPAAPARSSYRTGGPIGTKEWAEYSDQIASSGTVGDVLQAMITFYEDGITLEDKARWGELVEQIVEPAYEKICELNRAPATSEEAVPAETEAPTKLVDAIGQMNRDQLLGALTTAKMLIGANRMDSMGLLDMMLTRLIHQDDDGGDDEKPHPSGDNYARTELADPHPVGFTIEPISTSL